ncbi:uncharacterized protein LOC110609628 isoform X2 [Manihot esculenta]|uniref:uncharacterized protein LOC110609628 isoform X2 n=1 Tax=Manihot esculenta TaxID=3983 RepID=UPI001CC5ED36|nr:uncharacterized protein LOC110609628 isoform X2 [Manihot esculenta]
MLVIVSLLGASRMLQWMGGSRKKVTTSRKSIQKRQKQYFEQRRRQLQQQTAGLEMSEGGGYKCSENYKEHRSLDVLNLLNFSTSFQDCKPCCPSGRKDSKVNTSTVKNHIDPPIILASTVCPFSSLEITEASSQSGSQVETLSTKKVLLSSPDDLSNALYDPDNKSDFGRKATQQQLSFFDLLGDDDSDRNLEGTLAPEAHVAFSVDGLGKVGTETPPHSPRQLDRYITYGFSSPLETVEHNSSRNLSSVLNDLELEDAIMQDIGIPPFESSLEFSTMIEDSCGQLKKNSSEVRDCRKLRGRDSKLRSRFSIEQEFCNTRIDNEDLWDDFLKYGDEEMPNYAFGDPYKLEKRDCKKATKRFNFLDSPAQNHHTSENDYDLMTSKEARHHLVGTDFDSGNATAHSDWSCFVLEDAKENLSLLSEESCSSTAVRDEVTDISQVNYIARDTNRHQNAFDGAHFKHGAKKVLAKEKCLKNKNNLKKGNNPCWSGKRVQRPTLLEPRLAHNLNHLSQEKIGQRGSWLFEEGYRSTDMNLDHSSVCQTSKTQRPSSGSKPLNEGTFGMFLVPEPHIEVKFSFNRSKHGSPFKCSPHGSCISEKCAFCQSSCHKRYNVSSTLSNCELGAIAPDIFPESSDFELESRPPHSSQDAVSEGEKLILELSSVRSISKCEENNSESQQANDNNIMPQSGLECKELKDATLETLSSAKISAKPDSSIGGRVCLMNSGL